MYLKGLLILIFCSCFSLNFFAEQFIYQDSTKVKKNRLIVVGGTTTLFLGSSYYYLQNVWWDEKQIEFHFDAGADLKYALNVDKAGHFLGGIQASDAFSSALTWGGINKKKSLLYGAFFGSALQLGIEIKDAYAPYWGFSKWDLLSGSFGSFWPFLQSKNEALDAINFKFSYYKRSNVYWDLEAERNKEISSLAWQDDYPNQTYWASFDLNYFLNTNRWPEWLNVALGFGLDESQYIDVYNRKKGGNNELYIGFDYDLKKMFKKNNSPIVKEIKHWLNYFHFPAPAIRLSPDLDFYLLFL